MLLFQHIINIKNYSWDILYCFFYLSFQNIVCTLQLQHFSVQKSHVLDASHTWLVATVLVSSGGRTALRLRPLLSFYFQKSHWLLVNVESLHCHIPLSQTYSWRVAPSPCRTGLPRFYGWSTSQTRVPTFNWRQNLNSHTCLPLKSPDVLETNTTTRPIFGGASLAISILGNFLNGNVINSGYPGVSYNFNIPTPNKARPPRSLAEE